MIPLASGAHSGQLELVRFDESRLLPAKLGRAGWKEKAVGVRKKDDWHIVGRVPDDKSELGE